MLFGGGRVGDAAEKTSRQSMIAEGHRGGTECPARSTQCIVTACPAAFRRSSSTSIWRQCGSSWLHQRHARIAGLVGNMCSHCCRYCEAACAKPTVTRSRQKDAYAAKREPWLKPAWKRRVVSYRAGRACSQSMMAKRYARSSDDCAVQSSGSPRRQWPSTAAVHTSTTPRARATLAHSLVQNCAAVPVSPCAQRGSRRGGGRYRCGSEWECACGGLCGAGRSRGA